MYVRAPMNIVLKLTNSKNGLHMSKEELTEIFDHLPDEFKSMVFSDGMFISNDYIDDIDELEAILDLQSDKPFYIPTVVEIEEYYDFESLISKKTYQDMQKFLENEAKMDKDEVRNILIDTWCLIAEDDDVPYVIRCFMDRLKLTNKKLFNRLINLFMYLHNDTNKLSNRGFSPSNLPFKEFNDGQMPSLVPGSSQAAKILGDAEPQIREMGFELDLDGNAKEVPVYTRSAEDKGTLVRTTMKIYPNDPCPCGSGKKFKKCCGR